MTNFAKAREEMVKRQILARGIRDAPLIAAFRSVPRERFVSAAQAEDAYADSPLPIGDGQTISQPYVVAWMIEAANLSPGARVLEIGAGSGYAAAILGRIADRVISVERHPRLARLAAERLARLGIVNVEIIQGDGSVGYPDAAPYDAILAAASGSHVPAALKSQLAIDGILVMPVGEPGGVQSLVRVRRVSAEHYDLEELGPVRFVPLIGAEAWDGPGGSLDEDDY